MENMQYFEIYFKNRNFARIYTNLGSEYMLEF